MTLAMRLQEAEALHVARDVTVAADPLATAILLAGGIAALALAIYIIVRQSLQAPEIVAGAHDGRCLDCGGTLVAVHSTRGRVLYCPMGHCWMERRRKLGADVYRYRGGNCPHPHAHTAECAGLELEEEPLVG